MALSIRCAACKKNFKIEETASTRVDLAANIGEYFRRTCSECAVDKEYHVNDVVSEGNGYLQIISLSIGVFIVFIMTKFFWDKDFITNIGLIIGFMIGGIGYYSSLPSKSFNNYRMTRSKSEANLRGQGIKRSYKINKPLSPPRNY